MKSKRENCPHCKQKMPLEHHHSLNSGIVGGLVKLYASSQINPVKLSGLRLTRNEIDNFQKLRYWGLVAKYVTPQNKRKRGWWVMLDLGRRFVEKKARVTKSVWTLMGEAIRFDGGEVSIEDVVDGYMYHGDYADAARVPESLHGV